MSNMFCSLQVLAPVILVFLFIVTLLSSHFAAHYTGLWAIEGKNKNK